MILDACIHQNLQTDFDTFYKARVLTGIAFIYFAILAVADIWYIFSPQIVGVGLTWALAISLSLQLGYIFALSLLKYRGWFNATANFTIAATALGIAGGVAVSGGPLIAPATPMNILPIIMAFVLISKRAGLIWTQLVLAIHVSFMLLNTTGFVFPQLLDVNMLPLQHLAHWMIIYSAMIGLMVIYDTLNNRLKAERDAERAKFKHMASHDPLTNLANRLQFDENLRRALSRSDRHHKMTALLFIDLDHFKPINDTLGHDAGDTVLTVISQRLLLNLRETDTVARLGGDEFAVVLEDLSSTQQARDIANKLLHIITQPIDVLASAPSVSASIGIALYPLHTDSKVDLIKYADAAMYQAKTSKNAWQVFKPIHLNAKTPPQKVTV